MFYDNFKQLCDVKGITVTKAALDIGLSNATPTRWKKTGATPDGNTLLKIAEYFDVTTDYLLGKSSDRVHYEDLVDTYQHSIEKWSQSEFLSEDEITQIKMHYSELLIRYKHLIESFVNCSREIRSHPEKCLDGSAEADASIPQQKFIEKYLRYELKRNMADLGAWIDTVPYYFSYALVKNFEKCAKNNDDN
ncbi:MAG: helix-turn-helix transcriptional regulator [Oscillibacter sp.]|nr:helix-turn-helix transcriptional regulator [Oscillibacter sp.]